MKLRIVIVLVLFSSVLNSGVSSASEIMLSRFFEEVTTLEAHFDQKVIDETGFTLETSSGSFYLSRPGKFRWDYRSEDPVLAQGQQIIADGKSIHMYDPDLAQVTQRSLDDALGQVPSLLLVQTGANLDEHFSINDYGIADGISWIGLKPKDENAGYQQLLIGFSGNELTMISLTDGIGNETRLSLTDVKSNVDIKPDVFAFIAPEGVDVLAQ